LSKDRSAREKFGFSDNKEGPISFTGNVAHSIADKALGLSHGPLIGRAHEGTDKRPQQVDEYWNVNDFTIYKSKLAIYSRTIGGDFNEVKIGDVETGTRLRLNQSINNSLIVGRTLNTGNPNTIEEIAADRSLPPSRKYSGHQIYDGPGGLNNVHFEGFTEPDDYAIVESNAVHKTITHYVNKLTFGEGILERNKLKLNYNSNSTETKGIIDIDGSLTGIQGAKIIEGINSDFSGIYDTGSGVEQEDWNVIIYPADVVFGMMKIGEASFYDTTPISDAPRVNGILKINEEGDAITSRAIISGFGDDIIDTRLGHGQTDQFIFIANEDIYRYRIVLENAPLSFQFYMGDIPMGDSVIYELEGLDINFSDFTFEGSEEHLNQVDNLQQLQSATTSSIFRNYSSGTILVKFVSEMRHGFSFPQPKMTYLNKEYGGVKVNVNYNDTLKLIENYNEINLHKVSIYPNPVKHKFKIANSDKDINKIQIISSLGALVKQFDFVKNTDYDISNLKEGIYFVLFKNNDTVIHRNKMIKN
jgi:hypothetical protein